MIEKLIDKLDSFEIIRDEIAAILKVNISRQKDLAIEAGKDPTLWDFNVYSERSNPWEEFQDPEQISEPPIVNVWFDSMEVQEARSDTVERQMYSGIFNIDCYCYGVSAETSDGHTTADEDSAKKVHNVIRLVRNILMAGEYTYLGLPRGSKQFVWGRMVQTVNVFQPAADDATIQNIIGARIVFRVNFNELSPQVEPQTLEILSAQVVRAETGEILLKTEYQYNGD